MKKYKIAFVGMGSIGKRHFRNVCAFLDGRGDKYEVDLYRSSLSRELPQDILEKARRQIICDAPLSGEQVYDTVFVTNPTFLHYDTVKKFLAHAHSFFIEKPIFSSTEIDENLLMELKQVPSYVACPLRYNPVLQYVKEHIDCSKAIAVRAISSSYLPDWRPERDYRQCYSAHRDMGGGVGVDLIHEWDYLTHFFGMPMEVYSIQGQMSPLEIDSDDIAIYIARTQHTTIELHLDYFGRKAMRGMDIFLPDETIHCDIAGGKIEYINTGEVVELKVDRNAFQMAEIAHFFAIADGEVINDSDACHAYEVLKLTKGII